MAKTTDKEPQQLGDRWFIETRQYKGRVIKQKVWIRTALPEELHRLIEDIQALNWIKRLLDYIDPLSVSETTQDGYKLLRMARANVNVALRYANDKMRSELKH